MGERYGREMMLFVYVPERNIYFVSTEEGTTYAHQRAFKEKIISYIANQYQEPEKNWILWNLMDISTWRVFIRLKMDTLELHFLWKELYLVCRRTKRSLRRSAG